MKETAKLNHDIGLEYEALEDPKKTRSYFLKWVDQYINIRKMLEDRDTKKARLKKMLKYDPMKDNDK